MLTLFNKLKNLSLRLQFDQHKEPEKKHSNIIKIHKIQDVSVLPTQSYLIHRWFLGPNSN